MIERGVVADKIEEQAEAAGVEFIADAVDGIPGADARVGNIGGDGVGRGDYVIWFPAGEGAIVLRRIGGIFEGDAAGFGAAAPDAHEPDGVEAEGGDGIPGGVGNVVELDGAIELGRHAFEPGVGIDFVEVRVGFEAKGGGKIYGVGHREAEYGAGWRVSMGRGDRRSFMGAALLGR